MKIDLSRKVYADPDKMIDMDSSNSLNPLHKLIVKCIHESFVPLYFLTCVNW